ncbi:CBS domain-containing protein [Natronolimnobius baerhuensis]|nr:CBS domain-containing protein [Natronolimnobius baerhuensis]
MTTDVVTADKASSLETVAEQQLRHDVGSVIITTDGEPYGIITETDIVHAAYKSARALADISAQAVASHPLTTVDPDRSIRFVVKRMQDERIKKVVVVDSLEVVGIITTQDLIDHYGLLTSELKDVTQQHRQRRKFMH